MQVLPKRGALRRRVGLVSVLKVPLNEEQECLGRLINRCRADTRNVRRVDVDGYETNKAYAPSVEIVGRQRIERNM